MHPLDLRKPTLTSWLPSVAALLNQGTDIESCLMQLYM
jgi:hypothetical protein